MGTDFSTPNAYRIGFGCTRTTILAAGGQLSDLLSHWMMRSSKSGVRRKLSISIIHPITLNYLWVQLDQNVRQKE